MCYAVDADAEVVVTCGACKLRKTYTARAFVERLLTAGRVSPNLPA